MKKDDDSVGISVAWSLKGFTAKIKSRLVSTADRIGAQKLDEGGLDSEQRIAVQRALTDSKLAMIAAATKSLTTEIKNDPVLAQRALSLLARAEQKAENVTATFAMTVEDLRNNQDRGQEDGPDKIDSDLLARWQQYAEGATTEQLRERWGRVLAGEIRKPGTFSMKALRVIDEMDQNTAHFFETLYKKSILGFIPIISIGYNRKDAALLEEAGLIFSSSMPDSVTFSSTTNGDGFHWWILNTDKNGVIVRKDAALPDVKRIIVGLDDIRIREDKLELNVVRLTSIGRVVADMIPYDESDAFVSLTESLRKYGNTDEIKYVKGNGSGSVDVVEI